ncbi:MAG: ABC transporter ATP-binding protein [Planctomycetota bacterium]
MSDLTSTPTTPSPHAAFSETPSAELVYRIRGLDKSYALPSGGKLPILQSLDLDVYRSELLLIEGKSGIGKSTLLHMLGLLDRPDAGSLTLEGRDYAQASTSARAAARARGIGFVFQFFHLLPEFTAIENVLMSGQVKYGVSKWLANRKQAREKAEHFLKIVGLSERRLHRPNQLSGGERQRVALARALFNEPAVLLCDEPTGNLDVKTSEKVHELLAELNRETRQTMVVVTHDESLSVHANRIVHLEDGKAFLR